ncbi:Helix-turn-helix domain-containing protein [Amphibacillus marinus]|uniref:Helix-turn-helix domain-containing protein n=1 Tax=Amphibacillus marinus TaxID=872970 RepID=A0A1H8H5Z5_9BACI|nr:helix-turn-helix domain-containing protein [Amphibacillus marinus]SEN51439.1 Helix-turn-helix domain-containing protein [Amphibacillus marinus]
MKKILNHVRRYVLEPQLSSYRFYRKQIVIFLIVICVPSLLIGAMIYVFGAKELKQEMISAHNEQIINQVDYIDSQMQSLEVNLNYWTHEKLFFNDLNTINFQEQYQMADEIKGSLFSKQNGNSLIEKISVYVDAEDPILFNPQFRWVDEQRNKYFQQYVKHEDTFFWDRNVLMDESDEHLFPLVLVKNIPSLQQNDRNSASFIVELNKNAVMQMIDGLSLASDGFSFIIDKETGVIITSDQQSQLFFNDVLMRQGIENGSFSTTWQGTDYSVTSGTIGRVNAEWIYMSVVPLSFIAEPINYLSRTIVIISLIGLCLSFIIANMTFKSLNKPVEKVLELVKGNSGSRSNPLQHIETTWRKLNNEKDILEEHVDGLNKKLISNFFFQLIEGFLAEHNEHELRLKLAQYNVSLSNEQLRYLDIETVNPRQQALVIDLLDEVFSINHYVMTFNSRFIGVIYSYMDTDHFNAQMDRFYQMVNRNQNYEVVVMYLSQPVQDLTDLSEGVEQIRQKKYLMNSYEPTCLINMPEQVENDDKGYLLYPFAIEQQLLSAIRTHDKTKISVAIDQFIERVCQYDERAIQYSFFQLYSAIQGHFLQEGYSPIELFSGKNMVKELLHSYDLTALKETIVQAVIEPYLQVVQQKQVSKHDLIVKEAVAYIDENYMYDLSLEQCADALNINSYRLSKLFKQGKGINFIDYLTMLRIEKAKQLLTDSTLKIQDIALSVGYRHSYFNRIFKKHTAMTPGQFRDKSQAGLINAKVFNLS